MHEWEYDKTQAPRRMVNKLGEVSFDKPEPVKNLITWVYEQGSFVPCAKITENETFSIINDYIGRPIQAYDNNGNLVWSCDYDIYGGLRNLKGERNFIPFRQLGQYEDVETGLYYNRFRYYDCNTGTYISKDPIGLAGGFALYAYVKDTNYWIDIFGLTGIVYLRIDPFTMEEYVGKSKSPKAFENRKAKHDSTLRKKLNQKGNKNIKYDFEILEENIIGNDKLAFVEETNIREKGGISALENKISAMNDEKFRKMGGNIDKFGNKICT